MTVKTRMDAIRRGDDTGAALIIALVFITVVAVAVAALLAFADTSLRTTIALRSQAAEAAAADGAAQVVINELRNGNYNGSIGSCFGASGTKELQDFYQPPTGPALSTRVECTRDTNTSNLPSVANFGYALLTLPKMSGGSFTEDGAYVKANGGGGINIAGDVGSGGSAVADHATVKISANLSAKTCTPDPALPPDINGSDFIVTGTYTCDSSVNPSDPNFQLPPGATPGGAGTWTCNGAVMRFNAGVYSTAAELNALNGSGCASAQVYDFRPGVYWFNYSGVWTTSSGSLVAGSLAQVTGVPSNIGTACENPFTTFNPAAGVFFVFGNAAQWRIGVDAKVAVCAMPSTINQPPIATYGLKTGVGSVSAQTGCVAQYTGNNNQKCPVIQSYRQGNRSPTIYIYGVNYQPNAWIDIDMSGSPDQYYTGGVVARRFSFFAPASATAPTPLSSGPVGAPGPARTVTYLTVYVCPAASCATGGTLRLKVKVGVGDPSGSPVPGQRQVTVYTWSVQR